jgi:hypothetical protein
MLDYSSRTDVRKGFVRPLFRLTHSGVSKFRKRSAAGKKDKTAKEIEKRYMLAR